MPTSKRLNALGSGVFARSDAAKQAYRENASQQAGPALIDLSIVTPPARATAFRQGSSPSIELSLIGVGSGLELMSTPTEKFNYWLALRKAQPIFRLPFWITETRPCISILVIRRTQEGFTWRVLLFSSFLSPRNTTGGQTCNAFEPRSGIC